MTTHRPTLTLLLAACLTTPAWGLPVPAPLPTKGTTASTSGTFNEQVAPGNLLSGSGLDANQAHGNNSSAAGMWNTSSRRCPMRFRSLSAAPALPPIVSGACQTTKHPNVVPILIAHRWPF